MSYSEYTLEAVEKQLGITSQEADLFPDSPAAPDAIAGAASNLANDAARRARMGQAGKQRVARAHRVE